MGGAYIQSEVSPTPHFAPSFALRILAPRAFRWSSDVRQGRSQKAGINVYVTESSGGNDLWIMSGVELWEGSSKVF